MATSRFCSLIGVVDPPHARFDNTSEFLVWCDTALLCSLNDFIGELLIERSVNSDAGGLGLVSWSF